MSVLIVSIHDVSPVTAESASRWVDRIEALGVRATILVIPGPWRGTAMKRRDPLAGRLACWADHGHEISLHGWTHAQMGQGGRLVRLAARGAGEFAGLDLLQARGRLESGLEILSQNGLDHSGFTPPGWLISSAAAAAVSSLGIRYYTTHLGVHDLHGGRLHRMPVLCHRPDSRLSRLGAWVVGSGGWAARSLGLDLRLAIHPDDEKDRRLVDATLKVIAMAVAAGAEPMPYADFLERR